MAGYDPKSSPIDVSKINIGVTNGGAAPGAYSPDIQKQMQQMNALPPSQNPAYVAPSPYAGMFSNGLQSIMDSMPGYKGIRNPDGSLQSQYSVGRAVDPGVLSGYWDKMGSQLNDLSAQAHSGAMTQTGQLMDQRLSGQALNSAQDAGRSALDQMAIHGGVSSGAGERLANQNMVNQAQQVNQAHSTANLNDAQYKQGLLQALPGMYGQMASGQQQGALGAAQLNAANDRFNAGNAINDNFNQNNWGFQGWQTGASAYGNDQLAQGQIAAANKEAPGLLGSGGFLGTGIGGQHGFFGSGLFQAN